MPFSAEEIAGRSFVASMRGYDREEVEAFLRAVADDVRAREDQLEQVEARVAKLQAQLEASAIGQAVWMSSLLTAAEQAAARIRRDAETEAMQLLQLARRSSDATISRAQWVRTRMLAAAADGQPADPDVEQEVAGILRTLRSRRDHDYRRAMDALEELQSSLAEHRAALDALDGAG